MRRARSCAASRRAGRRGRSTPRARPRARPPTRPRCTPRRASTTAANAFVSAFGGAPKLGAPKGAARARRSSASRRHRAARATGSSASDGGVFAFGDARFHGSAGGVRLNQPDRRHGADARPARATGSSPPTAASSPSATRASTAPPATCGSTNRSSAWRATPQRQRLLARRRRRRHLHASATHASTAPPATVRLNQPIVGMAPHPHRQGLLARRRRRRHLHASATRSFHGSTGSRRLNQPIVGMAPHPHRQGLLARRRRRRHLHASATRTSTAASARSRGARGRAVGMARVGRRRLLDGVAAMTRRQERTRDHHRVRRRDRARGRGRDRRGRRAGLSMLSQITPIAEAGPRPEVRAHGGAGSSPARRSAASRSARAIARRRDRGRRASASGTTAALDADRRRARSPRAAVDAHAARLRPAVPAPAGERGVAVEVPAVGLRRRVRLADRRGRHDLRDDRGGAAHDRDRRAQREPVDCAGDRRSCSDSRAGSRCCSARASARRPRSSRFHRRFDAWSEPVRRAVIGVQLARRRGRGLDRRTDVRRDRRDCGGGRLPRNRFRPAPTRRSFPRAIPARRVAWRSADASGVNESLRCA